MDCLVALAATIKPVVARLDRAIQYAATSRLSQASLEYWVARSFCAKTRFALLPGDDSGV